MAICETKQPVCSLCGAYIPAKPEDPTDALSRDHVPPKQFYPKELRTAHNLNLWQVPTHRRCNAEYREDEEYFYHAVYALVHNANQPMGESIHRDLARRTRKPQTPAMVRALLREYRTVTRAGIHLPAGLVEVSLDDYRMQRVAIKIGQGLFYLDHNQHVPRESCKDVRLCETESDVPALYQASWRAASVRSVLPAIFSYRHFEHNGVHFYSVLYWETFMYCVAFDSP